MRIDKICKTCGFDSNGVCGMYTTCKEGEECDDWEASLEYYTEITKKAPWYIKKPYDQCKISYEKFPEYVACLKIVFFSLVSFFECWHIPTLP